MNKRKTRILLFLQVNRINSQNVKILDSIDSLDYYCNQIFHSLSSVKMSLIEIDFVNDPFLSNSNDQDFHSNLIYLQKIPIEQIVFFIDQHLPVIGSCSVEVSPVGGEGFS